MKKSSYCIHYVLRVPGNFFYLKKHRRLRFRRSSSLVASLLNELLGN
ncbi:unnamed protein product [Larinioides sclopetarius]|uniref:Ribosomal protein L36 n=1 Tax=Larinioides sclopetarius TaxID=280406 RepID=A0AAV2BCQ9_9ARAC